MNRACLTNNTNLHVQKQHASSIHPIKNNFVRMKKLILLTIAMAMLISCNGPMKKKIEYPLTKKGDVVDTYFGTKVPDPYRWLEDDRSEETAAWVKAENKVTFGYLEKIPIREEIRNRL